MDLKPSIVIRGNFNPAILHPNWFLRHSIVPSNEVAGLFVEPKTHEVAELGIKIEYGQRFLVEPDRAVIDFTNFKLSVDRTRFSVDSQSKEHDSFLPFVVKTFKILNQTPISAIGLNFNTTTKEISTDVLYKLINPDHKLIGALGQDLSYRFKISENSDSCLLNIDLEEQPHGLLIGFNFHYSEGEGLVDISDIITKRFEANKKRAAEILDLLLKHYGT